MRTSWSRAALGLAGLGAVVGPILDAIHTHTGTTEYAAPLVFGMAWWAPPLFAFAGLSVGLLRPALDRRVGRAGVPTARTLAGSGALFVLAYALSGLLPPSIKNAVLPPIFAVTWLVFDRTSVGLVTAVAAGLVGPALEIALVNEGAFRHLQPDVLGVPLWLPWLYASGAIAWGLVGKRVVGELPPDLESRSLRPLRLCG